MELQNFTKNFSSASTFLWKIIKNNQSKLIKFQKYELPFSLIIICLVINRHSSKINLLYIKTNRVPIKNHNRSKRNNHKSTFIYIYIQGKFQSWRSFRISHARLRTVKEPRTDTRSRSKMELYGTVTFQLPRRFVSRGNSAKPICGICLSPRLWASLSLVG